LFGGGLQQNAGAVTHSNNRIAINADGSNNWSS
jgi:hypothetical protein